MIRPKYNKQNNTIFMGFDSIEINLVFYQSEPKAKFLFKYKGLRKDREMLF